MLNENFNQPCWKYINSLGLSQVTPNKPDESVKMAKKIAGN